MKIHDTPKPPAFTPVTVTFETADELAHVVAALGVTSGHNNAAYIARRFGATIRPGAVMDVYSPLRDALERTYGPRK